MLFPSLHLKQLKQLFLVCLHLFLLHSRFPRFSSYRWQRTAVELSNFFEALLTFLSVFLFLRMLSAALSRFLFAAAFFSSRLVSSLSLFLSQALQGKSKKETSQSHLNACMQATMLATTKTWRRGNPNPPLCELCRYVCISTLMIRIS